MNIKTAVIAFIAACLLTGCNDDDTTFGIYSEDDAISTYAESFSFTSRSVLLDSVEANSVKSYLGLIRDPETGTNVKAEFLAQFHTFEDYRLPAEESIVKNAEGLVEADSVDLRLYFTSYYGEANNPMKIGAYELDRNNVVKEGQTYFSDIQLEDYLPANAEPMATKVFTPADYTLTDAERTSTSHYNNVRIILPREFGTRILRLALSNPEYFKDSWQFMHHVCAGFYFKLLSGTGTMLTLDVSALNVYFHYVEKDSTYVGISRFGATPEVIQCTRISNSGLQQLIDSEVGYTHLKSPAGIATELTLPVDDIYKNHENDTLGNARIILNRINSSSPQALATPSKLLLVRKSEIHSFFKNNKVPDDITSCITSFDSNYNTYTFSNLSRLLSYLHREKQRGMAKEGLTSAKWNQRHPDWNKVVLIPVETSSATSSSGTSTVVSVRHDFGLNSIRLVGGSVPLKMDVIYSTYR